MSGGLLSGPPRPPFSGLADHMTREGLLGPKRISFPPTLSGSSQIWDSHQLTYWKRKGKNFHKGISGRGKETNTIPSKGECVRGRLCRHHSRDAQTDLGNGGSTHPSHPSHKGLVSTCSVPSSGSQQKTSPGPCPHIAYILKGTQTDPGFMLWIAHSRMISSDRVGWVLGKVSLTE